MNIALAGVLSVILATSNPDLAGSNSISSQTFIIKDDRNVILNVPFVHQIDDLPEDQKETIRSTACGPASITMALNYLDKDISLGDVIEDLPNDVYVKGDRFYNLYKAPEIFGGKTVKIKNNTQTMYETLSNGYPIILNIQNYDGITGHAVVVTGMVNFNGEEASALVVHDPFRGPYQRFDYINGDNLKQPDGYTLSIGTLDPFYVTSSENTGTL